MPMAGLTAGGHSYSLLVHAFTLGLVEQEGTHTNSWIDCQLRHERRAAEPPATVKLPAQLRSQPTPWPSCAGRSVRYAPFVHHVRNFAPASASKGVRKTPARPLEHGQQGGAEYMRETAYLTAPCRRGLII